MNSIPYLKPAAHRLQFWRLAINLFGSSSFSFPYDLGGGYLKKTDNYLANKKRSIYGCIRKEIDGLDFPSFFFLPVLDG